MISNTKEMLSFTCKNYTYTLYSEYCSDGHVYYNISQKRRSGQVCVVFTSKSEGDARYRFGQICFGSSL